MPTFAPSVSPVPEHLLELWIKAHGGPDRVYIQPIDGHDPRDLITYETPQGNRKEILQWMSRGGRLDDLLRFGKPLGIKRYTDVLAGLNGGYSEISKFWGTPFIRLTTDRSPG